MRKKIWFFSIWSAVLILALWCLIRVNEFNWVLYLYIPMIIPLIASSYFAIISNTKRGWIVHFCIEFISLFISLGLMLFIGDIFNYEGGGMFPGFAYFLERMYSMLAAFIYVLNLFVTTIVFFIYRKRPFLGVIIFIAELIISIIIFVSA